MPRAEPQQDCSDGDDSDPEAEETREREVTAAEAAAIGEHQRVSKTWQAELGVRFQYSASERLSNSVMKKVVKRAREAVQYSRTLEGELKKCKYLNRRICCDLLAKEQALTVARLKAARHEEFNVQLVNENSELREQVAKLELASLPPIPRKPGYKPIHA